MRFTLYIFKGLHYAFIVAVLAERSQSNYHLIALIIALFLITYTYKHTPIKKVTYTFSDALNVVFVLLGALATFALSVETSLNTVFVASALGLLGAFIPKHKLFKEARVHDFSDWFVTTHLGDENNFLRLTYGHGSPFIFVNFQNISPSILFTSNPKIWSQSKNIIGLTTDK